jgi:hypothetical protein
MLAPIDTQASQNTTVMPTSGPLTMAQVMTTLNSGLASILSVSSGTTSPTNSTGGAPQTYQLWNDTSTTGQVTLRMYDGTSWVALGVLNTSTHAWTNNITSSNIISALGYTPSHNGSNSDITSITGLTTPLAISQGGCGQVTASACLNALGGLPLSGGTLTGLLTSANRVSTTAAGISNTYASTTALFNEFLSITAASATLPEQTVAFRMTSSTGGGTNATYKSAFGAESICNSGSSPCWGGTTVLTVNTGYNPTTSNALSLEVDMNNDTGTNCTDIDIGVSGVPCGNLLLTGASGNQLSFGLGIGGNSKVRSGIAFFTQGPIAQDIRSYDSSQVVLKDTGSHINGFDGSGASYSGNFLVAPSSYWAVNGSGVMTLQRPALYQTYTYTSPTTGSTVTIADTQDTAIINPAGTLAALTVKLPTCSSSYDGKMARFQSNFAITSLTVSATAGTVTTAPSTLLQGQGIGYLCYGSASYWFRIY